MVRQNTGNWLSTASLAGASRWNERDGYAASGMSAEPNPYESPRSEAEWAWPVPADPQAGVVATLVERGWRMRRFTVQGLLEAEIVWDGRGPNEFLRVNGRKVSEHPAFWYAPHFDGLVETTAGSCSITLDIVIAPLDMLFFDAVRRFRLCLDQRVVYEEGR